MKKSNKKMWLILGLSIILGITFIVDTGTAIENDRIEYESIYDLPQISEEEYIKRLAEEENITLKEARVGNDKHSEQYIDGLSDRIKSSDISEIYTALKKPDFFQSSMINKNISKQYIKNRIQTRGTFSYYDLKGTKVYSRNKKYSASVNATLKLYRSGSFGEISQVLGNVWGRRESGSYTYDWIDRNNWYDPTKLPSTTITIASSGYFEVKRSVGIGGGFSIPGFNYSGTVSGNEIYQSNTMTIKKSFRTMR